MTLQFRRETIPNTSSNATTGKMVFVSGPFALYCLIISKVAAGAVDADIAAITALNAKDWLNKKYIMENTIATAPTTSAKVIIAMDSSQL